MFSINYIIAIVFHIFLLIGIIVVAAIKKRNLVIWTIFPIGGYIILSIVIRVFLRLFITIYGFSYNILFRIAPLIIPVYLITLLIIAFAAKTKERPQIQSNIIRCPNCQHVLNSTMRYCPQCGSIQEDKSF